MKGMAYYVPEGKKAEYGFRMGEKEEIQGCRAVQGPEKGLDSPLITLGRVHQKGIGSRHGSFLGESPTHNRGEKETKESGSRSGSFVSSATAKERNAQEEEREGQSIQAAYRDHTGLYKGTHEGTDNSVHEIALLKQTVAAQGREIEELRAMIQQLCQRQDTFEKLYYAQEREKGSHSPLISRPAHPLPSVPHAVVSGSPLSASYRERIKREQEDKDKRGSHSPSS